MTQSRLVPAIVAPLWYLAHPVGAEDRAGVEANLREAGAWLGYLLAAEPDVAIIAPWLAPMLAGVQDDTSPEHRYRGMRDNLVVARRCDGIILCGGRISPGMDAEIAAVLAGGGAVSDLIGRTRAPEPDLIVPGTIITAGERAWRRRQSDDATAWSRS